MVEIKSFTPRESAAFCPPCPIIWKNGLLLAFCNLTGLWEAWAILWPIEPMSIGLGLLIVGILKRSSGAKLAGLILTGVAGAGFFIASFIGILSGTLMRFAAPGLLILTGLILVSAQWLKRTDVSSENIAEPVGYEVSLCYPVWFWRQYPSRIT